MVDWEDVAAFAVNVAQGAFSPPVGVRTWNPNKSPQENFRGLEPLREDLESLYNFLKKQGVVQGDATTQREQYEEMKANVRPSTIRYYKNMVSATQADQHDPANAVKSMAIQISPPANGEEHIEIEAQRDVEIIGFSTGDTSSLDKEFHQWLRVWLGGTDPYSVIEGGSSDSAGYADDSGVLFEFDMTTSDGQGYADNDGQTIMFPQPFTFPWNEGVTLNVKAFNSTTTGDDDAMDLIIYYVPTDGGGALR